VVGVLGLAFGTQFMALVGLLLAVTAAGALAAALLGSERLQDERKDEEVERLSTEHALLSDQLITAEQEERRRLALFLHDGPVQSMSGIALMLDAVTAAIEAGRADEAAGILNSALEKQRETIRSLRDLSFELEPVVLRDQGFGPAVRALADQLGVSNEIQIDLEVEPAEGLTEHAARVREHLRCCRRRRGCRRGRRAGRAAKSKLRRDRGARTLAERRDDRRPGPRRRHVGPDRVPAVPSASLE